LNNQDDVQIFKMRLRRSGFRFARRAASLKAFSTSSGRNRTDALRFDRDRPLVFAVRRTMTLSQLVHLRAPTHE
jgi:hypothetical protein